MALFDIATNFEPLSIEQVTQPGLLLPINSENEACLCVADGDGITTILLNGSHPYYRGEMTNRRGLFIPDVSILTEVDSLDEASANAPSGAIIRSKGVYGVRTRRQSHQGFTENVTVPLNGEAVQFAQDALRVAFTRWEIGLWVRDEWRRLWAVDVGISQTQGGAEL